jgi:hypothetical protein
MAAQDHPEAGRQAGLRRNAKRHCPHDLGSVSWMAGFRNIAVYGCAKLDIAILKAIRSPGSTAAAKARWWHESS